MSRWECEPQRLVLHIKEVLKQRIFTMEIENMEMGMEIGMEMEMGY